MSVQRGSIFIGKKTNTFCNIPILPIVQEIFEKYKDDALVLNSGKLLPVPSNQRMNAYLKEIQDICAIKTLITSHLARHSFATSICRDFGLPLPTLSKIMGHTSMEQTLKYAKLTDQKLNSDVQELKNKLSKANQATEGNSLSDVS